MIEPTALMAALGQPAPPAKIWQPAFDYIPDHFERLCEVGRRPTNGDLIDYLNDYRYCEVQPDFLPFLLPRIFFAWGEELLDEAQDYWFSSDCLASFAAKPLHPQYLNENQYHALAKYVGEIIRLRMGAEHTLRHSGQNKTVYKWFYALGSYGVVFPYLEEFWTAWWSFEKEADALCAVQYISCLMYLDTANPCFDSWNSQQGGGPPDLLETDGNIFD